MPRVTENFNLVYAAEGEILTADIEEDRYLTIDRQMLGIFEVFGNGVVDGWDITAGSGLSIIIDSGKGVINYKYVETESAYSLINLLPNSTLFILAQKSSVVQSDVDVFFSTSISDSINENYIIIGRVVTGGTSVVSTDTGPRNNISFVQAALDLVKDHRHYGGDSPAQIDLSREVSGELPSENIGDLDASKITSGRLGQSVIPQISHYDLEDVGTLTHAQIDSFIRMLSYENSHLLGEVASANLMQLFLSHKHFWANVDDYVGNMLLFIPGISPDSYSDTDATTATIDDENHFIEGIVSESGNILNRTYNSNSDFNNYFSSQNVSISSNKLKLSKSPAEELVIIDFENSSKTDEEVTGFTKNISVVSDAGGFKSTVDEKESGFYGGEITASQVVSLSYTKTYDAVQDWTDYDSLSVSVKATDLAHAQINMYLVYIDGSGTEITQSPTILLSQNEVTDGFKNITIDLSSYTVDTIKKIIFYTDTTLGWDVSANFSIVFDNIVLKKSSLYYQEGNIRYRISAPIPAQWDAISYNYVSNDGSVKIRARSASTASSLNLTPFSAYLSASGDSPEVSNNTDLEIDIIINSNTDKTNTPEIDLFKVTYIIPSSDNGFIIDSLDDWDNGTYSAKIDLTTTSGSVRIKEPISVGNIYYGNSVLISELDTSDIPMFGYRGNEAPSAPSQVAIGSLNTGYDLIYGVNRLDGGNYLFCDSGNDRIIEIDADGTFVFGMGTYVGTSDELTVLSSVYRSSVGYLTIVLSKDVTISEVDLTKFEIVTSTETIVLGASDSIVEDSLISSSGTASVFNILLSTTNQDLLEEKTSMKLIVRTDAFAEEISDNFTVSKSLRVGGLTIFKGNFIYVNDINTPVDVTLLDNGNYLVANAKKWGRQNTGVSSVVEISTLGVTAFSFEQDKFSFSLNTGGGASEYDDDFFALCGIVGEPSILNTDDVDISKVIAHAGVDTETEYTINSGASFQLIVDAYDSSDNLMLGDRSFWSSNNTSVISVDRFGLCTANSEGVATVTIEIEGVTGTVTFEVKTGESNPSISTANFSSTDSDIAVNAVGKTILVDRVSKKVRFEYISSDGLFPSSVDMEATGLFVISEKSLVEEKSSRIIKVDSDGNVLFDFGLGQIDSPNCVRSLLDNSIIIGS